MPAYVKKQYRLHWPMLYFLHTTNSNIETVAEFIDGSVAIVMLVLHRGRVFRAPASYPKGLCEENNYSNWSSLWYSSHD
jgi:hypothetical protein